MCAIINIEAHGEPRYLLIKLNENSYSDGYATVSGLLRAAASYSLRFRNDDSDENVPMKNYDSVEDFCRALNTYLFDNAYKTVSIILEFTSLKDLENDRPELFI